MQIKQIYEKYQIMPQLATHMLRVAGVGKLVLAGWQGEIDSDLVIRTLLLHDMGNITKFDLSDQWQQKMHGTDPTLDLPYWRAVQQASWEKYGKDTHSTTQAIVAELGQQDVLTILEQEHSGYASADAKQILSQPNAAQILAYCDVRVTPAGVVPMRVRIADLQARYGRALSWYDFLYALEESVRGKTTTHLDQINEASVEPFFEELLRYNVGI